MTEATCGKCGSIVTVFDTRKGGEGECERLRAVNAKLAGLLRRAAPLLVADSRHDRRDKDDLARQIVAALAAAEPAKEPT